MQFGTDTYRKAGLDRIEASRILLRYDNLSGSIYMGGLAVECMLRALIWSSDKRLDERHDLRKMAVRIENLGLLRAGQRDTDFVASVNAVTQAWTNTLRFAGKDRVENWLLGIGVLKRQGRGGYRKVARKHFDQCHNVLKRCEVLCEK